MKKVFKNLFFVLIAASLFAPALAQAQSTVQTIQTYQNPSSGLSQSTDVSSGPTVANTVAAGQNSIKPSINPSASVTSNTTVGGDIGCGNITGGDNISVANGVALCISGLVEYVMVGVGDYAANITAYIFDYAVQLSLNSPAYALDFIAVGWGVVRDVANMSFLFILIYIAFKIMFQAETAGTIRMLVWVVIIALLVNFSFFFTRIVIDAGNIVAVQFYNAIQAPVLGQNGAATNTAFASSLNSYGTAGTKDLTAGIMNALNVQSMTNGTFQTWATGQAKNGASSMYLLVTLSVIYIMTGVALYMLAATFIFVGVKFLLRIIALWFLIISAPIAFVAAIFRNKDGGSKWFNQWLKLLIKFSFYPAVFLFMFWVETLFLQEMAGSSLFNGVLNTAQAASSIDPLSAIALTAANVGIRLGFIIATLYVSLKTADYLVGEFSMMTGWIQNGYNKVVGGLQTGRRVFGLGGRGLAVVGNAAARNSERLWSGAREAGDREGRRAAVGGLYRSAEWERAGRKGAVGELYRGAARERSATIEGVGGLYSVAERERAAAAATPATAAASAAAPVTVTPAARDLTNVAAPSIPTGTRRLPGRNDITHVEGEPGRLIPPVGAGHGSGDGLASEKILHALKEQKTGLKEVARNVGVQPLVINTPTPEIPKSAPMPMDIENPAYQRELLSALRELKQNGAPQTVNPTIIIKPEPPPPTSGAPALRPVPPPANDNYAPPKPANDNAVFKRADENIQK